MKKNIREEEILSLRHITSSLFVVLFVIERREKKGENKVRGEGDRVRRMHICK